MDQVDENNYIEIKNIKNETIFTFKKSKYYDFNIINLVKFINLKKNLDFFELIIKSFDSDDIILYKKTKDNEFINEIKNINISLDKLTLQYGSIILNYDITNYIALVHIFSKQVQFYYKLKDDKLDILEDLLVYIKKKK